jgi:hypothetical protein
MDDFKRYRFLWEKTDIEVKPRRTPIGNLLRASYLLPGFVKWACGGVLIGENAHRTHAQDYTPRENVLVGGGDQGVYADG